MESKQGASLKKREVYLDALRVTATLAVMVIHLAATGYAEAVPGSYEWTVCLIYSTLARFAVPAFVMISGAMHLDPGREVAMKHMLKKTGKLMTVFVCWSLVYALTESAKEHQIFSAAYALAVVHRLVSGHYHMWYLYTIAGLYLATPFLRAMAADENLLKMYIVTAFALNFCLRIPTWIPGWEETAGTAFNHADAGIFAGFTGYYCLGCYLHRRTFTKKQIAVISLFSGLLMAAFLVAGILLDRPAMAFSEKMPQIFLYGAGVFLLFKSSAGHLERRRGILEKMVPCTFGMYLIHPAFNFLFRKTGLYALTFDPLLCIPLCALLVFGASFSVVWCMRKIPLLRKLT